jgi:Fur family ferric uptake transcriptional regulator
LDKPASLDLLLLVSTSIPTLGTTFERCDTFATLIPQQDLDALFRGVEDLRPLPGQLHTLLERLQRLLEREVAAFQLFDHTAKLRQHLVEALSVRWGLGHNRSLPPDAGMVNLDSRVFSGLNEPVAETAETVTRLKARFEDYVRRHGLKSTSQRDVIVDLFLKSSGHISIEDLLGKVRKRAPKVGYATVYRTLKLLTDCGIAAARQFGDGQTRFEVVGEHAHHDHLICVQCGLILEFENDTIEQLQDEMAEKMGGFKLVRHKLELYGLCPKAAGVKNGYCPNESS